MKKNRIVMLFALLVFSCLWVFVERAPAEGLASGASSTGVVARDVPQAPVVKAERGSTDIVVLSKSEITELIAGKHVQQYRNIDRALAKSIVRDLREYGLSIVSAKTTEELTASDHKQVLHYKLEKVEYGFKNPFGRHTNITVSYVFQKKDGTVLSSGAFTEFSTKSWRNCVRTISLKMTTDISTILSGKPLAGMTGSGDMKEPLAREKTIEVRLQELDGLQAKGLVTPEEYKLKRVEILKGL